MSEESRPPIWVPVSILCVYTIGFIAATVAIIEIEGSLLMDIVSIAACFGLFLTTAAIGKAIEVRVYA